jgi:hypothetical protein
MMNHLESFYLNHKEPNQSCLLALKNIILTHDKNITSEWKYGMPFFYYKGKMFCYLWVHKKFKKPYIGFIEGIHLNDANLIQENRARIKIMLFNPNEDLPKELIELILEKAIKLYLEGVVKIK